MENGSRRTGMFPVTLTPLLPLTIGPQIAQGNRTYGFQALLAMCGNSVNEDQSLGHLYETECLNGFVEQRLKMSESHFVGQVKTFS